MYLYAVTFFIIMCHLWVKKTYNYWNNRGVIGPKPLPVVGNFAMVMLGKEHVEDFLKRMYNLFPNENYIGVYQAWRPALIIKDPDMIKQILIKDFSVFRGRGFKGFYPFHYNALMADNDPWYVIRSFMTSLLTLGKLKNYVPLLEEIAENKWKYVRGLLKLENVHDIQYLFDAFMLQANVLCIFGTDVNAHIEEKSLKDLIDEFLHPGLLSRCMLYGGFLCQVFQKVSSLLKLDPRVNKIKKHFTPFLNKVLVDDNRRKTALMDKIVKLQKEKFIQKRYDNKVIQIENSSNLLLTQAFVMLVTHTGAPGKISSLIMYELALQQDLQDRLYREVNQVYRKHNNKLTYESLNEMTYLDMVIDETYRIHIGVPIQRVVASDYEFPGVGLKIKKGTGILIPSTALQMDPKYYRDPEVFDPERFSPENRKNIRDCTFLPFSIGPRNCLGSRVAQLLVKFCVASFIMKFKVEACEKTAKKLQFAHGLTKIKVDIGGNGGIWLNISSRSDSL